MELNNLAWDMYTFTYDGEDFKKAVMWSARAIEMQATPAYFDTYAQLQYTLGNKDEGIKYHRKALELSKKLELDSSEFEPILQKMLDNKPLK